MDQNQGSPPQFARITVHVPAVKERCFLPPESVQTNPGSFCAHPPFGLYPWMGPVRREVCSEHVFSGQSKTRPEGRWWVHLPVAPAKTTDVNLPHPDYQRVFALTNYYFVL